MLENFRYVQTLHARLITSEGREAQVWAKRPNMIRFDYVNGTSEISNGPTMWLVAKGGNKATQRSSHYYGDAQARGLDVVDALLQLHLHENFYGFMSEDPIEQITLGNKYFDRYQMRTLVEGGTVEFEALVDADTHLLKTIRVAIDVEGQDKGSFELSILGYDEPVADDMFEPSEGIEIVVETPPKSKAVKQEGSDAKEQAEGSILSGRISWAASSKPVKGAIVTARTGGLYRTTKGDKFFSQTKTNHEGHWRISGAPSGEIEFSVWSWEFAWPAMPTFTTNVGLAQLPKIIVDGQGRYDNLNFKVYKPENLYARVTINLMGKDGVPVEGITCMLVSNQADDCYQDLEYPRGKRIVSGPDGKIVSRKVWPTNEPVKVRLWNPDNKESPYVVRHIISEPFIVKPRQEYTFNFVLPRHEFRLQVVNREGKPVQGISVSVAVIAATERLQWLSRKCITDREGMVTIMGVLPKEEIVVSLKRYHPDTEEDKKRLIASAGIIMTAPENIYESVSQVTFDDRPIRIEGKAPIYPNTKRLTVRGKVEKPTRGIVIGSTRPTFADSEGEFTFEGVSTGLFKLMCFYSNVDPNDNEVINMRGAVRVEPGNIYVVEAIDGELKLVDCKPGF